MTDEKKFTLFWRDGSSEVVTGLTISNAFIKAGYGAEKMSQLASFGNGDLTVKEEFISKYKEVGNEEAD